MSAGKPNYQRLLELGKLPESQRSKVGGLAELDALNKRMEEIKNGVCDDCRARLFEKEPDHTENCEAAGCAFIGKGKTKALAAGAVKRHFTITHEKTK
jgi:hypothetical protein